MKRKHAHKPLIVTYSTIKSDKKEPLVNEHKNTSETQQTVTFPTSQTDLKKELQQYIDEQLNNRCNTTESISQTNVNPQTIIDDLRDELSETRTALDAVTLDRNQYKRIKELAECKLWDEQDQKDDIQVKVKELTDANLELTNKVQHLTIQNENLNKLLNHNSDNAAEELQLPKAEVRYIVFERTNLSKCIKATCLDTVIYYVKSSNTYAFTYDRIKSQLEKADVAMFHDHFIIKL